MTSVRQLDERTRLELVERLRRIEGQARGVARMIEEGRDCIEVVQQLMAIRAATESLCVELLQEMLEHALFDGAPAARQQFNRIIKTLVRTR